MEQTLEIIQASLRNFFSSFAAALPRFISALIILIIGWIIAKILKWAILKLLKMINFEGITHRIGINEFLMKGGIKITGSELLARLFYWIIMLGIWTAFFNTLGLDVVSGLLTRILLYIPNVIVAAILIVVGMYLAEFVSGLVVVTLRSGEVENADFFGRLTNGIVLFFVIALVLHQLGIANDLIETVVGIILGAAGLALALAFGLGGRDWAAGVIDRHLKR